VDTVFYQGVQIFLAVGFFLIAPGLIVRLWIGRLGDASASSFSCFSLIVESFLLSILITGFLGVTLSALQIGLDTVKYLLGVFEIVAVGVLIWATKGLKPKRYFSSALQQSDKWALALIGAFSLMMLFQGGVLDMLADGWWHMAYANQMVLDNSVFIAQHPISGGETNAILYPPLWHLQLALISDLTQLDLPIIWHFMAAFNSALLLSALYVMTVLLTGRKSIALVAVILHVFLVGGLSSYARVGAWPGNFSFVGLYYAFGMIFLISDQISAAKNNVNEQWRAEKPPVVSGSLLVCALVAVIGLHGVAAALFLLGVFAYWLVLGFFQATHQDWQVPRDRWVAGLILVIGAVAGLIVAATVFDSRYRFLFGSPPAYPPYLSLIIPIGIISLIALYKPLHAQLSGGWGVARFRIVYFLILAAAILGSVDWAHALELFSPNLDPIGRHVPRDFQDRMGNWVFLPFWEHQLRGGLLWSGIVSLLIGLSLPVFRQDRASIFIFSLCSLVFLVLFSPYFFTLTAFIIPLTSVYRVSLLLLSPIIFAMVFHYLIFSRR
jgi:hypothetical protein